jgi:hypothetical protein
MPAEFWSRVELAIFELCRLPSQPLDQEAFCTVLSKFDNLSFGKDFSNLLSPKDIIEFLDSDDFQYDDLFAWKSRAALDKSV